MMVARVTDSYAAGVQDYSHSLISVIDDDRCVLEATANLLRSSGFRSECFSSAEEFLLKSDPKMTRCLMLDIRMPGMSGLELRDHLAAAGLSIPTIFCSAHGSRALREQVIKDGAVELLTKPYNDDMLLVAIRSALERGD
jgi:FixJ family two-component response regulator